MDIASGLAERWVGIVKVQATALLAHVRLPPDYRPYASRWVAYVHTHRVVDIPIDKNLPIFGDVVVVHKPLKKPRSFENRGPQESVWDMIAVCPEVCWLCLWWMVFSMKRVEPRSENQVRRKDSHGSFMCIHRMPLRRLMCVAMAKSRESI